MTAKALEKDKGTKKKGSLDSKKCLRQTLRGYLCCRGKRRKEI
jgi:hypothetical protein